MNFCHSLRASSTMDSIFSLPINSDTTVHLLKSPKAFVERMTDDTSGVKIVSSPTFGFSLSPFLFPQIWRKFHGSKNPSEGPGHGLLLGLSLLTFLSSSTRQLLKVMLATHISPVPVWQ